MASEEGGTVEEPETKEETTPTASAGDKQEEGEGGDVATESKEGGEDAAAKPSSQDSEEQRIRGGGKVASDRGRNNRRYVPYRARASGGGGGSEEGRGRRVYVGNLAWEVRWQDLKDHMKSTGCDVFRADVMTTPDGLSKGCGIVEFATAEDAQKAIETLNDTELGGRQIFIREDREDRGGGGGGGGGASAGGGGGGGSVGSGGGGGQHGHHGGGGRRFTSGERAQSRRVYVGNLSWDVAWQDLKDHMRQAGEVLHAEIICEHNGRSKGCGIVEFASEDEAQEAINTLTDTELKGRMIFVREDRENSSGGGGGGGGHAGGGRSQNTSVYVWNLSYDTSWQDLKDHMRRAGNVDQATLLTDGEGKSIGCGVVVYQRPHEAARAIRELQGSELNGRQMYVREDRVQSGGRGRRGGGGHHGGGGGGGGGGGDGCQLFVGNLSDDTTWKELKDHFRQCGDVERAEVMTTADGKPKGFGTILFSNRKDAESAIERLHGVELQGNSLEVRIDQKAR